MYTLKVVLLFIILFYASVSAQFSAERFIADPFTQNISSLKDSLGNKAFEESEVKELTTITYYDWLGEEFGTRLFGEQKNICFNLEIFLQLRCLLNKHI